MNSAPFREKLTKLVQLFKKKQRKKMPFRLVMADVNLTRRIHKCTYYEAVDTHHFRRTQSEIA